MTPREQIDYVFFFIKKHLENSATISTEYIWNLKVSKDPETGINRLMFDDILKQLELDKLIEKEPMEEGVAQSMYHITFNGRLFDGYVEKHKETENQKARIRSLENANRSNANRMTLLTVFIAIGTIVAAIYYILEIIKIVKEQGVCAP
jgi:hypothetical protein